MYEERPRRSLLKEFIMKLILIIIFVLLLLWLVPWPNMDSYMNALNPLKDQIFNSNLQTMKDAGITYFTSERLPANVGDKTTLSLQKMLDMKLLIPFTDRNGNSCDVQKSYVSLEKKETEYVMKVNLKCGDEEDYILVHLGCYSYCDGAICEKQANNPEKPTTTPKPHDNIKTPEPSKSPTPTNTPTYTKYTCKYVNGQYWGKYSTVVSYETYIDECTTPTPTVTPTPVKEKEYEYKKETSIYHAAEYSKWSAWKEYVLKQGQSVTFGKWDTKEVEDLGYKYVKVGTQDAIIDNFMIKTPYLYQIGTKKGTVCKKYNYIIETTTTTTETTTTTTGGYTLVQIEGGWQDAGYWQGYNPPANTASTQYTFVGINFDYCGSDCVDHPYGVYKVQTRKTSSYSMGDSSSSSTISTDVSEQVISSGCAETVEIEVPVYINRYKTELKQVEIEPAKDIYKWIHYYRVRTRKLLNEAYTEIKVDYKWSKYNDTTLLNAGYKYTGKTRTKK